MKVNKNTENGEISEEMDFVFYDIAGENCDTEEEIEAMGKHVEFADGIILLLSPEEQIPGIVAIDGKGIGEEQRKSIGNVVSAMSGAYIGGKGKVVHKSKTRLAVAISKSDLLKSAEFVSGREVKENDIILQDTKYNSGRPGFMKDEAENVGGSILKLIGDELPGLIKGYYKGAEYFAISALGKKAEKTKDGSFVAPDEINSLRIEEPFFWILSELGIIDSVGGEKWTYNGEVVGPYNADGDIL